MRNSLGLLQRGGSHFFMLKDFLVLRLGSATHGLEELDSPWSLIPSFGDLGRPCSLNGGLLLHVLGSGLMVTLSCSVKQGSEHAAPLLKPGYRKGLMLLYLSSPPEGRLSGEEEQSPMFLVWDRVFQVLKPKDSWRVGERGEWKTGLPSSYWSPIFPSPCKSSFWLREGARHPCTKA